MSRFKWYRKWNGGYWVHDQIDGWTRMNKDSWDKLMKFKFIANSDEIEDWT